MMRAEVRGDVETLSNVFGVEREGACGMVASEQDGIGEGVASAVSSRTRIATSLVAYSPVKKQSRERSVLVLE